MATRHVRDAQGRAWVVRERWTPPLKALPGDADIDALEDIEPTGIVAIPIAMLFAVVTFPVRLLAAVLGQLFHLSFVAPLIEAEHIGPPYTRMTWRAVDRQIGPSVVGEIAAALERGDRRIQVDGARFLGFTTRRDAP